MTVTARLLIDYGSFTVSIGESNSGDPYDFVTGDEISARGHLIAWRAGTLTVATAQHFGELIVEVTVSEEAPRAAELGEDDELDEITIKPRGREVVVAGFAGDTSEICDPLPESPSGFYRARMIASGRVMDAEEPNERYHLHLWPCEPAHPRVTLQVQHRD
ncbi:hypothetical protein [Pseudoclavibacter helvolus]|uniref:hypothetical protein n=1 Tax=Pseudoclavibacter helvolus TaxID=255205 RepID=UPI003735BBFD